MFNVNLVWNDIDGCIGKFEKPSGLDRQNLQPHLTELAEMKKIMVANPQAIFAVCTGRSWHLSQDIVNALHINGDSVAEMGQVIYSPSNGKVFPLLPEVKPELQGQFGSLKSFIDSSDSFNIENVFGEGRIWRREDNEYMLTYEFDPKIDAEDVFQFLYPKMSEEIKQGLTQGTVKKVTCDVAIDIRMDIGKGEGIDYLYKNFYKRDGANALGIGDSFHSDIDMFERSEFVACPANSDEQVKDYVNDKKGYVAKAEFGKGVIEIYKHFL